MRGRKGRTSAAARERQGPDRRPLHHSLQGRAAAGWDGLAQLRHQVLVDPRGSRAAHQKRQLHRAAARWPGRLRVRLRRRVCLGRVLTAGGVGGARLHRLQLRCRLHVGNGRLAASTTQRGRRWLLAAMMTHHMGGLLTQRLAGTLSHHCLGPQQTGLLNQLRLHELLQGHCC